MLRLPKFRLEEPTDVAGAVALMSEHGEDAMIVAGGTDLYPNMKHGLFEPKVVVSLGRIAEMRGIEALADGGLRIGATTTLAEMAQSALVQERAPALAQAASLVAGPQLRTMGTAGGNVMLDTRCQWYNQTHFWRKSLGYCLKKDGTVCHVVAGGRKCVAAASNDTAPTLMTLNASATFANDEGSRDVKIDEMWKADGIWNKEPGRGEILTSLHIPAQSKGHRGAYGKLRDRGSIDYPLFGCAVRLDLDSEGVVEDADVVCVALVARPLRIKKVAETLRGKKVGTESFAEAAKEAADLADTQAKPMDNIPGESLYRRQMVPVYVRRTLQAAAEGKGPVHHV
ncbi:4-hydroxybenzoyl-CoA reductase subunit beta [Planctomycetes bacterium Poly30]|uniref:4-hydroxybenzoyl-CoA reductase subunit beta n=1 Tax=Saltatorellus ferox TaxID=2528018 RepID=A0A518EUF0_9BACT|nr:4-hydroxybenzoyl-CoA reductase subunit beta [Planctomycetes bacterium Poly30]